MATNNDTTNHTALSELAARAKRMGFEVHEQIGDDEREWRYRLVGPNVTDEGLVDMLDNLGMPQYGEVGQHLAGLIAAAEREAARVLDGVDYDRLTLDKANAIATKFDEIAELARHGSQPIEEPARAPAPLDASDHIVDIELADGARVDVEGRNYSKQLLLQVPSANLFDNHYQLLKGIIVTSRALFREVNEPSGAGALNREAEEISCALDCSIDQLDTAIKGGAA
ncbi:MAG: hypothetical protein WD672_15450 [Woeseia sp.]